MKAHNIQLRAFYTPELLEEGKQAFKQILPKEVEVKEELLEPETEGGVFTKPLCVLTALVSKQSQVKELLKTIVSGLSVEDLSELKNTLDSRVDDDCNLYLRLDKKALTEGRLILHTRDAIQVRIKPACFPKKKEKALEVVRELL
jgi:RNA binding exosome subunit